MNTLPLDVRDELDRIANEIICIGTLLGAARVFTNFPNAGISGLEGIMDGWYDALKRLSDGKSQTEEAAQ